MLSIKISLKCVTCRLITCILHLLIILRFVADKNLCHGAISTTRPLHPLMLIPQWTTVCWDTRLIEPVGTDCSADTVMTELFRLNKLLAMQCYMQLYSSVNTVTLNGLSRARKVTFVLTLGPVNLHTIQLLDKYLYSSVSYTITE
jgi:hypothetical protein